MPYPTLPIPRQWLPAMVIKAPYLRADAADAIALLTTPPVFAATQVTVQAIANNSQVPVTLDTEQYDNLGGHLPTANPANYYGMFPGWYLAQGSVGLNYTGGAGSIAAGAGLSQAGGALVTYQGQQLPNSGTGSQFAQAAVAKLLQMTSTGTAQGASNDFLALVATQSSGASRNTISNANQFPQFQTWWVAAASSGAGLKIVPPVQPWPVPPAYVTSAFMNVNVADTINFLIYPPICEAFYQAGTQTLASQASLPAVGTPIPMDTAAVDNYSAFSTGSGTWTAPVAGVYWVYCQAYLTMAATSLALAAGLTVTSKNYGGGSQTTLWGAPQLPLASAAAPNCAIVRRRLRLNAGDTIIPAAFQSDSGSATSTMAFSSTATLVSESRLITIWRGA